MSVKRFKSTGGCGFTLIEVMIAILILTVAVLGASGYRYHAALDARKAAINTMAARIGLLLCENWRGVKGASSYDPVTFFGPDLTITNSSGPAAPADFTTLGSYTITLSSVNYYTTLSWKDVATGLRALNVIVVWPGRGQDTTSFAEADELFKLTTYTLN